VAALVAAIEPYDDTERADQADVLAWLASTPEFADGRWWTGPELESADPALFDPAMGRFLAKLRSLATISGQPRA
jgi:hypothetical protein